MFVGTKAVPSRDKAVAQKLQTEALQGTVEEVGFQTAGVRNLLSGSSPMFRRRGPLSKKMSESFFLHSPPQKISKYE